MSEQIELTSFASCFEIESKTTFLAVHLNLLVIDRAESVKFSVIKFDFIFTTDSFDGTAKSFNDNGYFI